MAGRTIDPFAGGKLTMDAATFKAAREMLDKPPGHPANAAAHEKIYYAAMVLDHRQRALEAAAQGRPIPKDYICPICHRGMQENFHNKAFECPPCQRGITHAAIVSLFQTNPVPFTAAPPPSNNLSGMWVPSANHKKVDPTTYIPNLTSPIPTAIDPEDLLDKIRADKVEQDEPVVMWRSWRMLPKVLSGFDDGEDGKRYIQSINGVHWPHKEPLKADHNGDLGKHGEDGCPDWHCNCGIYGVRTLVQAQKWGAVVIRDPSEDAPLQVLGKVVFWGRVHVFETGAKAQFAYPKRLYISSTMAESRGENPERMANELAAQYGIEVEVDDSMYDLKLSHT